MYVTLTAQQAYCNIGDMHQLFQRCVEGFIEFYVLVAWHIMVHAYGVSMCFRNSNVRCVLKPHYSAGS